MTVLADNNSGNVTGLPYIFSHLPFHNVCYYFGISHNLPFNQILLLVFNAPANAAESDKRDLMKELDTMKQLKPHPYVIELLGCVTESGTLWLWGHFLRGYLICSFLRDRYIFFLLLFVKLQLVLVRFLQKH